MVKQEKKTELGFVCYLLQADGSAAPFDELTPEQRESWRERAAARLGEAMSDYFTQHPEEYRALR